MSGKNIQTFSRIITDEQLREMKDENRTPENFKILCEKTLFKEIPNAPDTISTETMMRWLKLLNFNLKLHTKVYYTDGHNRADVTMYRDKEFLPQIFEYERRMANF